VRYDVCMRAGSIRVLRSLGHGQIGRKMVFLLGHCLQARDGIWRSLLYPVLRRIDLQIASLLSS
jgi:hypothetical protein